RFALRFACRAPGQAGGGTEDAARREGGRGEGRRRRTCRQGRRQERRCRFARRLPQEIGMAEIVNLRMARKRKARADRQKVAAENRAVHGSSKAQRLAAKAVQERAATHLDGHRLAPAKGTTEGC